MAELLDAARTGDIDRVQLLLKTDGVQLMQTDEDGETALHLAAENGHVAVVRYLQQQGFDIERVAKRGLSPLTWLPRMATWRLCSI